MQFVSPRLEQKYRALHFRVFSNNYAIIYLLLVREKINIAFAFLNPKLDKKYGLRWRAVENNISVLCAL